MAEGSIVDCGAGVAEIDGVGVKVRITVSVLRISLGEKVGVGGTTDCVAEVDTSVDVVSPSYSSS